MATELRPPAKVAAPSYESTVDQQLQRAALRVRFLDGAAAGLIALSGIVGYGLVMSLADRLWGLPVGIRLAAWIIGVITLLAYVALTVNRVALRRVNPLFLARRLELTLPDAKNSVINWIDLRTEPLPPAIRGSLGRRAAKDIADADPDEALSARALWWLGSVCAALVVIQTIWLVFAPAQVASLLTRAFLPFEKKGIATRTELTLLKPAGGDVQVPAGQPVVITVKVGGYVPALNRPDSLKLHFRYSPGEPFEQRPLTEGADGNWTATVLADQVRSGFTYRITGGDARLPDDGEYRVTVKQAARVVRYEVTYQYRPYRCLPENKTVYEKNVRPSIRELRGTKATLLVRTNRPLKDCALEFKTAGNVHKLPGTAAGPDADAWAFTWVLEQSGEFRVLFTSRDGDDNPDREWCKFTVDPDRAPEVVITKPETDVTLPANGTLTVDGFARDDIGVKSLQLQMRVVKGATTPELKARPYRPDVNFRLVNGKYPLKIEYSDFVALESLQTAAGEAFPLTPGMELEVWLEARDNCDYPDAAGNLGQSKRFKVTIIAPDNGPKAQQDRKAAQQHQGQQQQKQDKDLKAQNSQAEAEKNAQDGKGGQGGNGGGTDKTNDQVHKAIQKAESDENNKGGAKGGDDGKGDKKDDGGGGAGGAGDGKGGPPDAKDQAGNGKGDGNQSDGNPSGNSRDAGQPQGGSSNAKDKGDSKDQGDAKGDGKSDSAAKSKDGPPDNKTNPAGDSKDKGGQDAAKAKDGGGMPDMQSGKGDKKNGDGGSSGAAAKGGDKKDGGTDSANGATKGPPPAQAGGAKDRQPGDKAEFSDAKGGPDDMARNNPPPGEIKGNPAKQATSKAGPGKAPDVTAKGGGPGDDMQPKAGPDGKGQAANSKGDTRKDATADDVAKLQDQAKQLQDRDAAEKGLDNISKQADDPKVRDAARKALDDLKNQSGNAKDAGPPGSDASAKADGKGQGDNKGGKEGDSAAKGNHPEDGGGSTKGKGQGGIGDVAKGQPKKAGSGTPGGTANGNVGSDVQSGQPVDEAAARKAGELQLETLKKQIDELRKKLTPKVLAELKWTEKEREDYLDRLLADALLRLERAKKAKPGDLPPPGSLEALLPAARLTQNRQGNGGGDLPPDAAAEPPPEVRQAQKIFQNK
jgi:hypothetical protein